MKNEESKDLKKKGKKRGKKVMIIIAIIVGILILAIGIFTIYKLNQLKKLGTMSARDMINYVTQKEGSYISMGVIENGEITYYTFSNGGQLVDANDNYYEIGSISKTFAGLLISKAVEDGLIDLKAPISRYLDLPEGKYYPTIERLVTHTSGYKNYYFESEMIGNHLSGRNDFYGISKAKLLERAASLTLEDKVYPFVYSNFGLSIVGLVLESVYQKDYTELLTEYLHSELQLMDTSVASSKGNLTGYWDWAQGDGYIPAGAIISNIADMTEYLRFCMTSEFPYVRNSFHTLVSVSYTNTIYQSMGIYLNEVCTTWIHDTTNHIYWHNGGTTNYNSYIAMNEDGTRGVVMLSNTNPSTSLPVTVIGSKLISSKESIVSQASN